MKQKKERPIIFNGEMVRAILDGRKTQTRRVVEITTAGRIKQVGGRKNWHPDDENAVLACPFGMVGDRLWVRETFAKPPGAIVYRADVPDDDLILIGNGRIVPWKPSIHMPRWASRITLEITGIRIERLQEITAEDVKKEWLQSDNNGHYRNYLDKKEYSMWLGPRASFLSLWESVFGDGSWDENPYVWVIEFRQTP